MKKTDQIAVHISFEAKAKLTAIAEIKGLTVSECACQVIDKYLERKEREFSLMKSAFGATEL